MEAQKQYQAPWVINTLLPIVNRVSFLGSTK